MSRKGAPAPAAPLPDLTTTKEVINALKQLYMEKMRPIEVAYNFAEVCAGVQFLMGVAVRVTSHFTCQPWAFWVFRSFIRLTCELVTLKQSPWCCCWASTPSARRLSSDTCWAVISRAFASVCAPTLSSNLH